MWLHQYSGRKTKHIQRTKLWKINLNSYLNFICLTSCLLATGCIQNYRRWLFFRSCLLPPPLPHLQFQPTCLHGSVRVTGENRGPTEQTHSVQKASWEIFNHVWKIKISHLRKLDQSLTNELTIFSTKATNHQTFFVKCSVRQIYVESMQWNKSEFWKKENQILLITSSKSRHASLVHFSNRG